MADQKPTADIIQECQEDTLFFLRAGHPLPRVRFMLSDHMGYTGYTIKRALSGLDLDARPAEAARAAAIEKASKDV